MNVIAYPQPGKARSLEVLSAFAAGCDGEVIANPPQEPLERPAVFYGHRGIERLILAAKNSGRDWYYGDNSFFDRCRGRFFRFARNAFQISRLQLPDHERVKALGIKIEPWRKNGRHIVIVEQSSEFLQMVGQRTDWLIRTAQELVNYTDRPLRIRSWRRDKDKAAATLASDLDGAWMLVTHASAAAVEALILGIPALVTGPCAATPMASGGLDRIESPRYPEGREDWAAGLAAMQWTIEEIRRGDAWRALRA